MATVALQAQETQELAHEESKDRELIHNNFEVFMNKLVLEFQAKESASSSGKL